MEEKRKLEQIKAILRPTEEERRALIKNFHYIKEKIRHVGNVSLMGSVAKDTFLRNSNELDVFVFIEKNKSIEWALEELKKALKNMKTEVAYAQHPYIRAYRENLRIDIVPAYYIKEHEPIISQVDRTRMHVEYVKNHLKHDQKDEVRLLKQFLKNINCYGAEIKIKGLSGYFCECLIIKKGNFLNALKYFSDMEFEIRDNGIYFPDPVDEKRNIAASLSNFNLAKIVCSAISFFENKKIDEFFFFSLDNKIKKIIEKNMKGHVFSISFDAPNVVEDLRFGVLRKTAEKLIRYFEQAGIKVINYYVDNVGKRDVISFIVVNKKTDDFVISKGPSILFKHYFKDFLKKHKKENIFLSQNGVVLMKKRAHKDIKGILKNTSLNMKFYKNKYRIINKIPNFMLRELALERLIFGG